MKRSLLIAPLLAIVCFVMPGCYSLKSQSIPEEIKTINVGFFENNAQLVVSYLSLQFTEALKARIRTTTRLSIVSGEGDAGMSGAITDYRSVPVSIQAPGNGNAPPIAGAQSLSLSVRVRYNVVSDINKTLSFDQTFTKSINYSGNLAAQEQQLLQTLTNQIIDDIFNKAFNNW